MDESPFVENKKTFGQWMKEHQSGLYLTVIFHLIVLILLTVQGIHGQLRTESVFVIDFTREEAEQARLEEEIRQEQEKEEIKDEVDEMIRQALNSREMPRNVIVNTEDLRNDMQSSNSDNKDIYEDAKAVQERLDATRQKIQAEQGADEVPIPDKSGNNDKQQPGSKEVYKGPSVLSYTLEGRKVISMPVPVYKCPGGGDVTVSITVNQQGYVTDASVQKSVSTDNECLHEAAKSAARRSRFNIDTSKPNNQKGEIVYRFIAQ